MPQSKKTKGKAVTPEEEPKRLEQYNQCKPEQMTFFEQMLPEERRFSNTIELYDFIPKYVWGKVQRVGGQFLKTLDREFECRGRRYRVKIHPARLPDKDGEEREYFPSKREELVEDALRKFASEGQGLFLDEQASVTFSLYQLQNELKKNGHSYSKDQLKDALMICAQTKIVVHSEDGDAVLVSSVFQTVGLTTREDWEGQGQKTRAFVRFNPLVTESIKKRSFRQINYEKSMSFSSVIARQLHKRMAHHYTQASMTTPYHILLSTIIRDFGLTAYAQLRDNLRDVENALQEMQQKEVVAFYRIEKTFDSTRRNKLADAKFIITPHPRFVTEVTQANKRQLEISKLLSKGKG